MYYSSSTSRYIYEVNSYDVYSGTQNIYEYHFENVKRHDGRFSETEFLRLFVYFRNNIRVALSYTYAYIIIYYTCAYIYIYYIINKPCNS